MSIRGKTAARVRCSPPLLGENKLAQPPKTILICSCEDTMRLDRGAIGRGCPDSAVAAFRHLCGTEIDHFREAAGRAGALTVACTYKAALFTEEAADRAEPITFANVRETAGWSSEGAQSG